MNTPDMTFYKSWLDSSAATALFETLENNHAWKQEHIMILGSPVALPRLTAWYGDSAYRYSGIENKPLPWTPCLVFLRDRLTEQFGTPFNSVLCNFYRSGKDSVAWHADDECELGQQPVIASLSLGGLRKFSFKPKHPEKQDKRIDLFLENGDLLVMRGNTQKEWLHQIPKTKRLVSPRINLTFRYILG